MTYSGKLTLGLVMALGACNHQAVTSRNAIQLGPNPVLSGGTYSSGGGITIATELRNIGGVTGICGAWSESEEQAAFTRTSASGILESASVFVAGKKLHHNLIFMRKTAPVTDYAGAGANCIRTKRPWQPGDESRTPQVRIPRQIAYVNRSSGGKLVIMFKPTGPGAFNRSLASFGLDLKDTKNSRLGRSPMLTGGSYSSGGGITVAVDVQEFDGIAYVCGAWAESKTQSRQTEKQALQVLASGSVALGGQTVIRDLRFMRKVKPRGGYGRKPARCISTGLPWTPGYANQRSAISIPRQIVHQSQGQVIHFVPGRPGA